MKKLLLLSAIILTGITFSGCDKKEQENPEAKLYNYISYYNLTTGDINYFTLDLNSCYGVKYTDGSGNGTVYADFKVTGNTDFIGSFRSVAGVLNDSYLTNYWDYSNPKILYEAKATDQTFTFSKGTVATVKMEFPDIPVSIIKIGNIRVSAMINHVYPGFVDIYTIPYMPKTNILLWN